MAAILERRRELRDLDWQTALCAIAIATFGVWMIHNAAPTEGFWSKQIIGIGISLVAFAAVCMTDYRRIIDAAPVFYVIGLFLLLLVLTPLGATSHGQKAWLKLPLLGQFQPSEFVKIPTVLMLAKYLGATKGNVLTFKQILVTIAIWAGPVLLIMLEPDTGQTITYLPILAAVIFLSGIRVRYVVLACVAAAIFLPAAWYVGVHTGKIKRYQEERVLAITNPDEVDPRGFGYHTIQSTITVGKGGLVGNEGDPETSQSVLKFLPEPHSDFIFAVAAENTGFIGCVSLLLAYAIILSRMIAGARQATDRAGMLVIMAVVCGMIFQIFMNVGMALGILPVIGVPLPLMSAGVSAVLTTFVAIGFVVSVKLRRFVN